MAKFSFWFCFSTTVTLNMIDPQIWGKLNARNRTQHLQKLLTNLIFWRCWYFNDHLHSMKEGNVFSRDCPSVHWNGYLNGASGSRGTPTHLGQGKVLDLTYPPRQPRSGLGPSPRQGQVWHLPCSTLPQTNVQVWDSTPQGQVWGLPCPKKDQAGRTRGKPHQEVFFMGLFTDKLIFSFQKKYIVVDIDSSFWKSKHYQL